jgi:hypothetical protein
MELKKNEKINWDFTIIQNDPLAKCILLSLLANYIIKTHTINSDTTFIMVSRPFPFIFENSSRYQNTINTVISFIQSHSYNIKIQNNAFYVYERTTF